MSSKKGKAVGTGIKLVWQMDKWLLIHSCIGAVIESAIPFIGIFLSAYILDGLQAGEPIQTLLAAALLSVAGIFVLTLLKEHFQTLQKIHTDVCGKRYDTLMSMKTISMDYPLLDSPQVNAIRARIRHDNDWGAGFYSLAQQLPWLLGSFVSCIFSLVFLIPLFTEGIVFQDTASVFLLLLFAVVIFWNLWFGARKRKEYYRLLDNPSLDKSYLSHFLWNDQDYHYGKDIRVYGAKPLIESKLRGDVQTKKQWMHKIIRNSMKTGFSSNFSAGLLQLSGPRSSRRADNRQRSAIRGHYLPVFPVCFQHISRYRGVCGLLRPAGFHIGIPACGGYFEERIPSR